MARSQRRHARLGYVLPTWLGLCGSRSYVEESPMRSQRRSFVWVLLLVFLAAPALGQTGGSFIPDVVYGHKDGMALTLDVLKPSGEPNGAGVLIMVSAGWVSSWTPPEESIFQSFWEPLLEAGFTVFSVRHGSSPRLKVPEAYADVRRAVRFVRLNARTYGVDPERLGVWGGSAGGQLSLMLGLASDEGDPSATDEVLRESSRVAAVVACCPPVDLRTRVAPNKHFPPTYPALSVAGGIVRPDSHVLFPALDFESNLSASVSPVLHASSDDPPTLLIHGDSDPLVDVNNSRLMHKMLSDEGVITELMVVEGAGHGFEGKDADRANRAMVDWFVTHLVESN